MRGLRGCVIVFFLILILASCGKEETLKSGRESDLSKTVEQEPVILTYGYIDSYNFKDLDEKIQERIVYFNRNNENYQIEIIKYGEDSYTDGLSALNADISAGRGPDIIEIPNEALLGQFGRKGVVENLYSYMDEGEVVKREDFLENILSSFETEGNLYGLTPFFKIYSLIANPKYISSKQITFAEFKELYETNKENDDVIVYNRMSKQHMLEMCVLPSIEKFVDMEDYSCDFVNSEIQELLEFCLQFEDDSKFWNRFEEDKIGVQEGNTILYYDSPIQSFSVYKDYEELCGEKGNLIGFPGIEGNNPEILANFPFLCINSKSEHKETAWQFLCTFLQLGYLAKRDNLTFNGFPVTQKAFEAVGEKLLEGQWLSAGEKSFTDAEGKIYTYMYIPITQEDLDYIKLIISEAIPPSADYGEIENIIREEAESYWNGYRTVEAVMESIQNRAQLYLNEIG